MHIGINALYYAHGGTLVYLQRLLRQWSRDGSTAAHRFTLFTGRRTLQRLADSVPPEVDVALLPLSDLGMPARLLAEQTLLVQAARSRGIDVMFCPGNNGPFWGTPSVVTFHNAGPFSPALTPATQGWGGWLRFRLIGAFMKICARRANHLIFLSQTFRREFSTVVPLDLQRTTVLYHAREEAPDDDSADVLQRCQLPPRYALLVSHLYPFRNVVEAVQAFADPELADETLVVAGGFPVPAYAHKVRQAAEAAEINGRVRLLGETPRTDVVALMRRCRAFLFTSSVENCPTTVIEALSMGLPMALSSQSVMPEIAGDAAVYFHPLRPHEVARAVGRVMHDEALRADLQRRALAQAAKFPTEAGMAAETLRVITGVETRR